MKDELSTKKCIDCIYLNKDNYCEILKWNRNPTGLICAKFKEARV